MANKLILLAMLLASSSALQPPGGLKFRTLRKSLSAAIRTLVETREAEALGFAVSTVLDGLVAAPQTPVEAREAITIYPRVHVEDEDYSLVCPEHPHVALADLYLDWNDLEGAEHVLRQALGDGPDAELSYALGRLLEDLKGDRVGAEACWREVVRLDPGYRSPARTADAFCRWADALLARGDRAGARGRLLTCLRLDGAHAKAHYLTATLHADAGALEEAAASCRAALASDPGFADALVLQKDVARRAHLKAAEEYVAFARKNHLDVAAAEQELLELKLSQRRAFVAGLTTELC